MKIYNRTDFLKLPEGVIYAKGKEWYFEGICIKGETLKSGNWSNDWYCSELNWIDEDSSTAFETLDSMLHNGKSAPCNQTECRDGMFEDDDVFLVYEKGDLEFLKASIETAIKISDIE